MPTAAHHELLRGTRMKRKHFVVSDVIIETGLCLLLFVTTAKLLGLGHLAVYALAGGAYGLIGYALLRFILTECWSPFYEYEEDVPELMDFRAAILALFLPPLVMLIAVIAAVAGIVAVAASPFLPKEV